MEVFLNTITPILYTIICVIGIIGNAVVIYVILLASSLRPANLFYLALNKEKNEDETELKLREKKTIILKKTNNNDTSICQRIYKRLKFLKLSVSNYYLINLAISDFILLFFMIFLIITVILKQWVFGIILCKIYFSIVYICQLNAAFIISILSVDRWLAVRFPLKIKNFRNLFITKIIIFLSWINSTILTIPVMVFTTITQRNETTNNETEEKVFCELDINSNLTNNKLLPKDISPLKAFQFYWLTINFILPVTMIIVFYLQVLRLLKINSNNSRLNRSSRRNKAYKKITIMCLVIIACYVICWTPYWTIQIILSIKPYMTVPNRT
jgi:hypothetical protein